MAEEEGFPLTDPRSQAAYDRQIIEETLHQVRGLLASAKVNQRLAQEGLLEENRDLHPMKFVAAIKRHQHALEVITAMMDELTDDGLPDTVAENAGKVIQVPADMTVDEVLSSP